MQAHATIKEYMDYQLAIGAIKRAQPPSSTATQRDAVRGRSGKMYRALSPDALMQQSRSRFV